MTHDPTKPKVLDSESDDLETMMNLPELELEVPQIIGFIEIPAPDIEFGAHMPKEDVDYLDIP